jgi:hypothetical protein
LVATCGVDVDVDVDVDDGGDVGYEQEPTNNQCSAYSILLPVNVVGKEANREDKLR